MIKFWSVLPNMELFMFPGSFLVWHSDTHPGSIVPYQIMLLLYCDRRICCVGGVQKPKQFSECLEWSFFSGVLWLGLGTPQALRRDCTQCCGLNGAPRSTPTLTELAWFQTHTHTHNHAHTTDSVDWRWPTASHITQPRWVLIMWVSTQQRLRSAKLSSFSKGYLK